MAMATGQVVKAWTVGGRAYLAVRVVEAGGRAVEYIGSVDVADLGGKSLAQQKALLVAAVKAERETWVAAASELAVSGTVTV